MNPSLSWDVLVWGFSLPDTCWKFNAVESVWEISGECGNKFLIQLVRKPARASTLLDLMFEQRRTCGWCDGWRPSWPCNEFSIHRARRRTVTLDFQRADFSLLGIWLTESLGRQSWRAEEGRLGTLQEGNLQGAASPHVPNTSRWGRKPVWLNRDLAGWNSGKSRVWAGTVSSCPLEKGVSKSGGLQGCHELMHRENEKI